MQIGVLDQEPVVETGDAIGQKFFERNDAAALPFRSCH
jgi:hypothetical protein